MTEDQIRTLHQKLWDVADILRGRMDADEYRDYILGFIFYRYLSEIMESYADGLLRDGDDDIRFRDIDETTPDGMTYLDALRVEAVENKGFFLKPSELFAALAERATRRDDASGFILSDLKTILRNIENSTLGTASQVDFELELIRRDEINVSYILRLLADAPRSDSEADRTKRAGIRKTVLGLLETEPQLRSKRELIEEFIRDYWDEMHPGTDIESSFDYFWDRKRDDHISALCDTEELRRDGVERLIAQYRFSGREPVGDDVIGTMLATPKILERRRRITSATNRIMNLIDIFEDA
jgi:hypothetical protein